MLVLMVTAAALTGFVIGFGFWRWVLGDRNWIEGCCVGLPLAILFGLLPPAFERIMHAAETAKAEKAKAEKRERADAPPGEQNPPIRH